MIPLSFKRHRFPPVIIRHSIWLYARFTLSLRDVEEMLAERKLDVSYETVRRWFLKLGPVVAANLKRSRPRPSNHWHLNEMAVVIRGWRYWLWRAVDNEGEVLDFLVQPTRDAKAAIKLLKKLLKRQGFAPSRIIADKLRSYRAVLGAWASRPGTIKASERTTGRKIHISRFEDGNARCCGSSRRAAHSASRPSIPPPTAPSTINATY